MRVPSGLGGGALRICRENSQPLPSPAAPGWRWSSREDFPPKLPALVTASLSSFPNKSDFFFSLSLWASPLPEGSSKGKQTEEVGGQRPLRARGKKFQISEGEILFRFQWRAGGASASSGGWGVTQGAVEGTELSVPRVLLGREGWIQHFSLLLLLLPAGSPARMSSPVTSAPTPASSPTSARPVRRSLPAVTTWPST